MGKPDLDFDVLDWADEHHVLKVALFGTNHEDVEVYHEVIFPEPVTIIEVHAMIAKINNGRFRSD